VRVTDGDRLIAEKIRRKESEWSGERTLEVVLVIEVAAAQMIFRAKAVVETREVLRVVDVVVGG
jgi:hypothetical protein